MISSKCKNFDYQIPGSEEKQPLIVRIFSNNKYSDERLREIFGCHAHFPQSRPVQFYFNKSGVADLVIVFNTTRRPFWTITQSENVLKVLQEPIISNPLTHRFTYKHERFFSEVFTYAPEEQDKRQKASMGFPLPFVSRAFNEGEFLSQKSHMFSVVSSKNSLLPGHQKRNVLIDQLLSTKPELANHTYGRGRRDILKKEEGLINYRFSLAIENSTMCNYVTDKYVDCILTGTIPVYLGAPNINEYFPAKSFIAIEDYDLDSLCSIIEGLTEQEYLERLPYLTMAAEIVRAHHDFVSFAARRLQTQVPTGKRRLIVLYSLNSFLVGVAHPIIGFVWKFMVPVAVQDSLKKIISRLRGKGLYESH